MIILEKKCKHNSKDIYVDLNRRNMVIPLIYSGVCFKCGISLKFNDKMEIIDNLDRNGNNIVHNNYDDYIDQ